MKKIISAILALSLCVSASMLSFAADETELSAIAAEAESTKKPVVFDEQIILGDKTSYPRMTALGDGTLLLVGGTGTKFLVKKSSDGGKTWSEPVTAADYSGTEYKPGNGYLYYDTQTEKVFLSYRCPIYNADGTYTSNVMMVTSEDYGDTWSEPYCILSSTVTVPEDGSTPSGAWEPTIYRVAGKLRLYHSCSIVKEGDGQVIMNKGTANEFTDETFPYSEQKAVQRIITHECNEETGAWGGGVSTFEGYPNHPYVPYEGYVYFRAGMQAISLLSDGTYAMVIESSRNANASKYGGVSYPMVIDICFSKDGVNFTEPRTIACGPREGYTSAAPWIVTLPDGRIAVSYQTDAHLSEPHPTSVGEYKQLFVSISNDVITYDDNASVGVSDFVVTRPHDSLNSEVTYNYWNSVFIDGYKLYAVGNVSTNDKKVTPAKGLCLSIADLSPDKMEGSYTPIYTANDMLLLMNREGGFGWGEKYILMNDIDLADATNGLPQAPIGYANGAHTMFKGVFDGNGHTIRGLDLSTSSAKFFGLFGYAVNANIRDLTLYGRVSSTYALNTDRTGNGCAAVCGFANGTTKISGVTNYAAVTATATAGGIVGYVLRNGSTEGKVQIINCNNYADVTSLATSTKGAAGGIVGVSNLYTFDMNIHDCSNYGTVSGYQYVGGILGSSYNKTGNTARTSIERCTNEGNVSAKKADAGGIVGLAWYTDIASCINRGAVSNTASTTGGICGRGYAETTISKCVNDGSVYSKGRSIMGNDLKDTVTISSCYYTESSIADDRALSLTSEAEALKQSYAGFDFINTFEIKDGRIEIVDRYALRMGDLSGDGLLSNADITVFIRLLSGYETDTNEELCDTNGDGKVNNRDAVMLVQKLAGWDVE